jgi:hypothetical protein
MISKKSVSICCVAAAGWLVQGLLQRLKTVLVQQQMQRRRPPLL